LDLAPRLDTATHIGDLPTNVVIVVVEIVNEALTNVMKHSTDQEPELAVTVSGDTLVVSVTNRYDGRPVTRRGTGTGALIDRAGAVGGSVHIWQDDDRFVLEATLPIVRAQSELAAS
jgi:signal transduction histidine kinase